MDPFTRARGTARFPPHPVHNAAMAKRLQIALAVLLVAVAGVIVWQVLHSREREPLYQCSTMSSWLNSPGFMSSEQAMQVWRGFGSNAVPFLRIALEARDGPAMKAYWAVRLSLPNRIDRQLPGFGPPKCDNSMACRRWG
jgi:hypothetical protein